MKSVQNFIKSHVPLCIGTLGFAILGYMGYRAVRWVIKKCQKEQKVEIVANEALSKVSQISKKQSSRDSKSDTPEDLQVHDNDKNPVIQESSPHSSQSTEIEFSEEERVLPTDTDEKVLELPPLELTKTMECVKVSDGVIHKGQGEYIAYRLDAEGKAMMPTAEEYEKIYSIINEWSPQAILARGVDNPDEACKHRDEIIREKIREVAPDLKLAFVPRTLYELVFVRKCIREDVKRGHICEGLNHLIKRKKIVQKKQGEKCWHLCCFSEPESMNDPQLQTLAFRLNKSLLSILQPGNEGLTYRQLQDCTKNELNFLKEHYVSKEVDGNCNMPGPAVNFQGESKRGAIRSMGIRNENDEKIVLNALALDCSQFAQDGFILYRGSVFSRDNVVVKGNFISKGMNIPRDLKEKQIDTFEYSLSYGSGLFSGCVYDGGATAYYYMRKEQDAFALVIPYNELSQAPFYIPPVSTLAQLYGQGEIFHARTKVSNQLDISSRIPGLAEQEKEPKFLASNMSKNELHMKFRQYMENAIRVNG